MLPSHAWQVTGRHANRHETISRHNFHTHTATQATVDNSNTAAFELRNDEQSREGDCRVGHGGLAWHLTERVGWVLQLLHHICEARAACRVLVPARLDQRNDFWAVSLRLSRNRRPAASFDELFDLLRVVKQRRVVQVAVEFQKMPLSHSMVAVWARELREACPTAAGRHAPRVARTQPHIHRTYHDHGERVHVPRELWSAGSKRLRSHVPRRASCAVAGACHRQGSACS